MRKKTIKFGLDSIFWYIIYLLPIIITVCVCIGAFQGDWYVEWYTNGGDTAELPFIGVFNNVMYDFGVSSRNPISSVLISIFGEIAIGENGILPIFSEYSPIFYYLVYFIGCVLLHILVDFILFIPRLCHKWMNAFTKTED